MKRKALLLALALVGAGWICGDDSAQETKPKATDKEFIGLVPPPAEPGFKWVREVRYHQIEHRYCKEVPDKRSKWVYDTKPDYFCTPRCPIHLFHHQNDCDQCEACQSCKGPCRREIVLKKRVEWECGTKCVVETVKEKIPYIVWRKVPLSDEKPDKDGKPESLPSPRELPLPQTSAASPELSPR